MEEAFNLEEYLAASVEKMVKSIVKTSLFCPKEEIFMAKYALASKAAAEKRKNMAGRGTHVPPFLIASITSLCNLHCSGCYARSVNTCEDGEPVGQLDAEEWRRVFREAGDMGVGFIILLGGEPLVRKDVIREAAKMPDILFPVFTNGTMITEEYLQIFDSSRNLAPVLSIEGGIEKTDARRGRGIYGKLSDVMAELKKRNILFGASITVTKENLSEVTSEKFIDDLIEKGCRAVFYVEFVPTSPQTERLAPENGERELLAQKVAAHRKKHEDILFISFPGDEKSSGGCLAAGRGFFHINSHGGAEPCPFSPYSDSNVRNQPLAEALHSKLFTDLRSGDALMEEHKGGCVLYERRDRVEALLRSGADEKTQTAV